MFAVGCLLLIILPLAGFVAGLLAAGMVAAFWGAGIGLLIAAIAAGISGYALVKAGRRD